MRRGASAAPRAARFIGAIGCVFGGVILVTTSMPARGHDITPPWASRSFGDFWLLCDAQRNCRAFSIVDGEPAVAGEDDAVGTYLEVARSGAPDAEPDVAVGLPVFPNEGPYPESGPPLSLQIDVPGGGTVSYGLTRTRDLESRRYRVADTERAAVARDIGQGTIARVRQADSVTHVSLRGGSAGLRFIDDWQRRVGTTTALVARGVRPPTTVPTPPPRPRIQRRPRVSQAGLPAAPPAAIEELLGTECDYYFTELEASTWPVSVARLSRDLVIYGIPCASGAYNVIMTYVIVDARGVARLARIERAGDLVNGVYDPSTRTLTEWERGRGLNDYGSHSEWTWNGRRFVLTHRDEMGGCCGMYDPWPAAFDADVVD